MSLYVNAIMNNLPASNPMLQEIRSETEKDKTIKEVSEYLSEGWPKSRSQCSKNSLPYWEHRSSLTKINGLIINGERIVIPKVIRAKILERIHEGHLGTEKCKRRARQNVYWPGMNSDIENKVKSCKICCQLQPSKPKLPMMYHNVPTRPWEKVGSDIFFYGGENYLIIADYYSLWPEVYRLSNANSLTVIDALKQTFSRHGIPKELVSDNGSQYKSKRFRYFMREWNVKHTTSSPRYPRSNGFSESMVKSVKRTIKKCSRSKQDICKGLLILRNTPLSCGYSPAELCMGRQLDDNLPKFHRPRPDKASRNLIQEREKSKQTYDRKIPPQMTKEAFSPGTKVAIQDQHWREWSVRGKILRKSGPRSYDIMTEDKKELRRTQTHIRKVHALIVSTNQAEGGLLKPHLPQVPLSPVLERIQDMSDSDQTIPYNESWSSESETIPYNESSSEEESIPQRDTSTITQTKSGRVIKKPSRYR